MQLETLIACFFGELSLAVDRRYRRQYYRIYHNNVEITGRLRSLRSRHLLRGNYEGGELRGFVVRAKGVAELENNGLL